MTPDDVKGFLIIFAMGAGFGCLSIGLSGVSEGLFGVPLGFAKLSLKNFVKCGPLTGTTFSGLVLIDDTFKITNEFGNLI